MDTPLVSVFLVTYNSSNYVLEALESVKDQTYPNIELIISDDASKDNTIEICRNWIEKNKHHFKNTILITSEINTGVAPNCNRAIKASSGIWLKVLAGDDKLLPDTITNFISYVTQTPKCDIVFGKLYFYGEDNLLVESVKNYYEETCYPLILQNTVKKQFKSILKRMYVPGPGLFFKKDLWEEIGGYDEKYPMAEEYPFTFEVLKKNYYIYFLDKISYGYRVREDSICHDKHKITRTLRQGQQHFLDKRLKEMLKNNMWLSAFDNYVKIKKDENKYKKRNNLIKFYLNFIYFLSPLLYKKNLQRLMKKIKA